MGSGKSAVLEYLGELGAETLQADRIGHDQLREPEIRERVIALLGESVRGEDGELDRKRVGERVFADPELLRRYNELIHPPLLERLKAWLERPRERIAAVEAALIPEWGIEDWFDEVWCVTASDQAALRRWNGDEEIFWSIRKAQFAPPNKRAKAERVIDNERSQEELRRRISEEWRRFRSRG